jgi:hypothetical protein
VFGTFDDICAIVRRDAAAYGIALDAHGKIAWVQNRNIRLFLRV